MAGEKKKNVGNFGVASDLVDFLNASPTAFHAVEESKRLLKIAGYEQLSEREDWELQAGRKYYFTRNHSTIIAFAVGKRYAAGNGFNIIAAHTDSPCLKLKPVTKVEKGGCLEVGVQTYGNGLWHTWFDRDLSVAGRMIVRRKKGGADSYSHQLVKIEEPIMRIPTLAIHLDSGVHDGFKANTESHLVPVLATAIKAELNIYVGEGVPMSSGAETDTKRSVGRAKIEQTNHHLVMLKLLATYGNCEPDDICDFELQACDVQPSIIAGLLKEFVFSGRLDNLCMSFCSLKAFIDVTTSESSLEDESGVRMVALFDHEEVRPSAQAAGSPVLVEAISRVTNSFNANSKPVLEKNKHEVSHQPKMHGGLVIKHDANQCYATNAVTSFIIREIARKHNIPIQDYVVRNDMPGGSSNGPILASGIGIRTVDVGIPQLSMHSIREMCAVDDVNYSYEHFKAYFKEFTLLDSKLSSVDM